MKSLLKCCGSTIVVGLHTRAFVIEGETATELNENSENPAVSSTTTCPTNKSKGDPQHQAGHIDPREIQCVAVAKDGEGNLWCAISRYNKSLSVFCNSKFVVTHMTIKRAGCLVFGWDPVGMIVAGDMVGDATAYSLEAKATKGRILLGHTASMLTGMQLVGGGTDAPTKLLTADRDEKVRISSFPETTIVHGYLLGHEAFLSSIDTTPSLPELCITCGGDESVRLWNINSFEMLSIVETVGLLPTQVSMDGERVGVIFNDSNAIHVYTGLTAAKEDDDEHDLKLQQSLECETQPLGIVVQDDMLHVLAKEPVLLQSYQLNAATSQYELLTGKMYPLPQDVVLLSSILEADRTTGHLKMQKLKESRGAGAQQVPWHRIERRQKAKDSRARRNRKRKAEKQES
jgi:hypothetical protein